MIEIYCWIKFFILLEENQQRLLHYQGWRNVFTTGPAKLDYEEYAIKCVGVQQLPEY